VELPTETGYNYSASVDWGDTTITTVNAFDDVGRGNTYSAIGVYLIDISGTWESFRVDSDGNIIETVLKEVVNWGLVNILRIDFFGCGNLTTIPTDSQGSFSNVLHCDNFFRVSGLTSIPVGLFDNMANVTQFRWSFYNAYISSIPDYIFQGCNNSTTISLQFMFRGNNNLITV